MNSWRRIAALIAISAPIHKLQSINNTILVTGGAGFIGPNFILDWITWETDPVVNLDKLTYAGNLQNLASLEGNPSHTFVRGDIGDSSLIDQLLANHKPRAIVNFAAESHVDRLIHGPGEFIQTNMVGTFHLLESTRSYWGSLSENDKKTFASCMSLPMRSMARSSPMTQPSRKPTPTSLTAPTPPARPLRTTWSAHITTLMAYRCSPPIARIITAPIISRKNSSH